MDEHVIVVGGGIGGLCSGIYLLNNRYFFILFLIQGGIYNVL